MDSVNVLLNTGVLSCVDTKSNKIDALCAIGDLALSPVRYFFNGHEVKIIGKDIHHVTSFMEAGKPEDCYCSKTYPALKAGTKSYLKTALMILFFIPGLILGTLAKCLAYRFSESVRENHELLKKHFAKKIDVTLGTKEKRLGFEEIKSELESKAKDLKEIGKGINNLIIYGKASEGINEDPGIVALNPQKLILVGTGIIHTVCHHPDGSLDSTLANKKEWLSKSIAFPGKRHGMPVLEGTFTTQFKVASVAEALNHLPPKIVFLFPERFHAVYHISDG